ncbi:MAG: SPFH domain-containing protein [Clostridiales bacterium]|nr:SPFH domain-containing protein [Clostridiales bacterium]
MAHIVDLIKYEGDNTTFIWKHPSEDFNTMTQLVVHENQEAVFVMNGQLLDLFGPGRYTLETENIPLLGRVINKVTGGVSPFHCEVYFINKTEQMAIKWGTDSKVQFMEPTYHFPIEIGACGEMSLRADNSRKLLIKLVGTESVLGQEHLTKYFRAFLMTRIKTYLAQTIREQAINIFEMDEHLNQLSEALQVQLQPEFREYGVELERFFVTTIVRPEGDAVYERFKTLYFRQYADVAEAKLNQQLDIIKQQTEAQKIVIESQALAQKRIQEGYTYAQERSFDVAGMAASNESVGQFTNMGIGLGTMTGVGSAVGGMLNSAMSVQEIGNLENHVSQNVASEQKCPSCGSKIPAGFKFCPECGEKLQAAPVRCPKCGTEASGFKFCPECGEKL